MVSVIELRGVAAYLRQLDNELNYMLLPSDIRYELNIIVHLSTQVMYFISPKMKLFIAHMINNSDILYLDSSVLHILKNLMK